MSQQEKSLSEKEKSHLGLAYFALGPELTAERATAKELTYEFNQTRPSELDKRKKILKKLLGSTQENFYIEPPFQCDYGYNIEIGDCFYANHNLIILDCAKVKFGKRCFVGPNVSIYTPGHPLHHELRNKDIEYAQSITIGDNVWLGGSCVINPGVKIGDNVVVGSGSVVTKDVPSNSVVAGNPAKVIKQITDEDKQYYYRNRVYEPTILDKQE
ncbi:Acetyltransferase [Tieghemostelium lacteum]|uniref:Acetyltransferase n=1 Tax=Tieghemostelium lacteum TaxID=361077 RepID=A0A151ZBS2_TIELA|nr:Acetyltransferase [Tieghemostelium lacteum]|eukprot:KYQ91375.1 Acetyltransferase [Tieghemostelium lacteum]